MKFPFPFTIPGLALAAVLMTAAPTAATEIKRTIEHVKGDVYRFNNAFHSAMFVVTADGIVVTDPISAEAVEWLAAELVKRFDKPVTHMIYSHFHPDHNSGGQKWGGVTVIAHENTKQHIAAGRADTALPDVTFTDSYEFRTGGKTFELTYLGTGHSDDLVATVVRPENVAFVVDAVSPRRLPYRDFPGADIDGLIEQIKVVETLDFEILVPGHGPTGTKPDAADARLYLETLRDGVKAALEEGKSVEDIIASDLMSAYDQWGNYQQWRAENIAGMARWLQREDAAR